MTAGYIDFFIVHEPWSSPVNNRDAQTGETLPCKINYTELIAGHWEYRLKKGGVFIARLWNSERIQVD